MSGGKLKKGAPPRADPGGTDGRARYADSWSRAGKQTSAPERDVDRFLDQQGWRTSERVETVGVEATERHSSSSLPSRQRSSQYRPVAGHRQVAYERCHDWGILHEVVCDEPATNGKKGKQKKAPKGKS